jgi:hypothetical protein
MGVSLLALLGRVFYGCEWFDVLPEQGKFFLTYQKQKVQYVELKIVLI